MQQLDKIDCSVPVGNRTLMICPVNIYQYLSPYYRIKRQKIKKKKKRKKNENKMLT